jgi:RNA polymerase sigma-B factor
MHARVSAPVTTAAADAGDVASELIAALAALPAAHPSRAALRRQAITAWQPMAERLARRYAGRGESADDLRQTAMIGLIKAVDRFDPERGSDFVGYALPTILGELRRHFRDRTWSMRVPRKLQEMRMAINEANGVLAHRLGRAPTVADIAAHLGATEEEVVEGLEGARAYRASSLSTPLGDGGSLELVDTIGVEEDGYEGTEAHLALGSAMASLTERERRIVTLRFYGNQTQAQIAEQFGVSQMHISRLLTKALGTLRRQLDPDTA